MINLDWNDAYEIGIDFIDQEHQAILSIMRNIRDSILNGNLDACATLSDSLIKEAGNHFSHEERFLERVKFPGLKEHKKYHGDLLAQAEQVKKICEGTIKDHKLAECFDAMEEFLIDDIINGDLQFVSFLEYEGHIKRKFY
jgi:hemerythrin-like metal-binding protein